LKPAIVSFKIIGWDKDNKEYDLSDCISDTTDSYLSDDIEEWREEDES
jgi:hypothetical protein